MSFSYDDAADLKSALQKRDARRHSDLRALRRYWQGDYWEGGGDDDRSAVSSVTQLFRDLKGQNADIGPDLKLVHNVLQEVCVKYQTYLCPVPMVKTFIDPPFSEKRKQQSVRKQRAIEGTWWANKMAIQMAHIGWYLPLMGDCFIGVWPDFDRKVPRLIVRSPEVAHPVRGYDGVTLEQIVFCWEETERTLKRSYPKYQSTAGAGRGGKYRLGFKKANAGGERKVEVIEYCDTDECSMWADGQLLRTIKHGYGFNLFDQMSFIPVPNEPFNHGAVEQIVSLVEMGNALHSLLFQATLENVFPMMVIEDPSKAPEEIMRGAGAVVPVNAGGKVYYESPPVQALPVQVAFLRDNQDKILQAAGMPRVAFGESPTTSIATGAAINELQGAGSGSTVEMVQGTGIGPALESWNEKALFMYQNIFRKDTIELYGTEQKSITDTSGRQFALTFKGSEIVGSTRNKVIFSPHMDDHEKLVMGLQGLGGGIFSKRYVREQLGISDNEEMVEEIVAEALEDGVVQAIVMQLQAEPTPENEEKLLVDATTFLEGAAAPPAAHPLLQAASLAAAPGGPGPTPPGAQQPGGLPVGNFPGAPGQAMSPALALPAGSPPPAGASAAPSASPAAGPGPQQGQGQTVKLQDAVAALAAVPLNGRAWLAGEIVQRGQTSDPVDVFTTDDSDRQAIQAAAQFPINFHPTDGEPQEQAVEVGQSQQAQ